MEISKPNRAPLSQKFIIKTKTSMAHNMRSENSDPELPSSLDGEVELFLQHMVAKSRRFKDLLVERKVDNGQ